MELAALDKYNLSNYVIKKVSSVEEMCAIATIMEHEVGEEHEIGEGRMPTTDYKLFYNTDPDGSFIGQLDGKTIGCISMLKYGDKFAVLGTYIVLKEFRGNGYGLALFKHAMESVPTSCNIGLDSVPGNNLLYHKWGFVDTFAIRRAQVDIPRALEKLDSFNCPSDVLVQSASAVDFNKLSAYDSEVFGAPHHLFLQGLLDGPNTITMAATNQNGDVVGFVAARKMIIPEEGWKLAPLFADNAQIASVLLKIVFKGMLTNAADRKIAIFELLLC